MGMKYFVLALCLLGASHAVPVQAPQASVQTIFDWLELNVQHEGKELIKKAVTLLKHVEDGIQYVKEIIPDVNKKLHEDANEVLVEIKDITNELKDLISTKNGDVQYGFGILDDLTNLAGGFKLSTAIRLVKLASSVNKVCQDAKELKPKFTKELDKIQDILQKHATDLVTHVIDELGVGENKAQKGIVKDLEDVLEQLDEKFWDLVVNLIQNVNDSLQRVKELVPKVYTKIHEDAERLLDEIKKVADLVKAHLHNKKDGVSYGYGILDDITDLAGGFKLSTAMRILQLAASANKVCQDAKQFEPKLEKELDKVQNIIHKHVNDLATHVIKEFGLGEDTVQKGIVKDIEDLFEDVDEVFYKLVINLLKEVENGIERVKEIVPKVHEKIHEDADKVLNELREVIKSLKSFVSKEIGDIYYGYGIFDDLTDLAGGFKLSTAMRVLQLAASANKVCQDAKQFEPNLEKEFGKIQDIIHKHVTDLATHVVTEFGLGKDTVQKGIVKDIEDLFEDLDESFYKLVINLLKEVENGIEKVKELMPKIHEKIHEDADKVLSELREIIKSLKSFVSKEIADAQYGYGIFDDLTDLTGGFKLSTAMRVLQLAGSAHKVYQDAKEFEPKFEKELNKIQGILEKHVSDLANHVVNELGVYNKPIQKSIVKDIEDLLDQQLGKIQTLILTLFKDIEIAFDVLRNEFPAVYKVVEQRVDEIRDEMHSIVQELKSTLQLSSASYGILDIAGTFTRGTTIGTVIRIVNVISKFNTVVQDVRGFGPHVEILLEHSVQKVTASAKDFYIHASKIAWN